MLGRITFGTIIAGAFFTTAAPAVAQTLSPAVSRGEDVIVTDASGREHKGQLLDAGADGLMLAPARDRQVFTWQEITTIRHRRRDSPLNGLLIGIGAGALGGFIAQKTLCSSPDPECTAIVNGVVVLPMLAGGAAIGALADTFIRKEVVVYRSDGRQRGLRLSVAPTLTPHVRGVQVAWTF